MHTYITDEKWFEKNYILKSVLLLFYFDIENDLPRITIISR